MNGKNRGRVVRHVEVRRMASYFFREWSLCGNPLLLTRTKKKYHTSSKLSRPSSRFSHHRTDSQGNTYYLLSSHSPFHSFVFLGHRMEKKSTVAYITQLHRDADSVATLPQFTAGILNRKPIQLISTNKSDCGI
jgi:hypothetical protein